MRYDLISMLPDRAFQTSCGRLATLEGGGGGKGGSAPAPPAPPAPPPEAAKAPDSDQVKARNKARMTGGMDAGPNSTMLTGPDGVDPNSLELGKNSLLGG